MKIRTEIKSGSLISDASDFVKTGLDPVVEFVAEANDQAKALSSAVTDAATETWNFLSGLV